LVRGSRCGPTDDVQLEVARATLPDALWKEGPKAVNTEIRRLIEERGASEDGSRRQPAQETSTRRAPIISPPIAASPIGLSFESEQPRLQQRRRQLPAVNEDPIIVPAGTSSARVSDIDQETPISAERIPPQSAGPHFVLSTDLKIALAPAAAIGSSGDNLARIRQQLPLVRKAAEDLAGHLNPNAQPEIVRNLADYRTAIAGEPETIAWGVVFGLGVRLDNAATASRRKVEDRLQPPLEDAAQEALDTVLTLHGPLIRATSEGRELTDEADRFRLTRDQAAALREDA
jgi:hypothetical protein